MSSQLRDSRVKQIISSLLTNLASPSKHYDTAQNTQHSLKCTTTENHNRKVWYFRFRFPRNKKKKSVVASYLISVGLFFSLVTSSAFSLIASSMSFSTTPASMSDSEENERQIRKKCNNKKTS